FELICLLDDWLVGCWLIGWSDSSVNRLIDWLFAWLVGRQTPQLIAFWFNSSVGNGSPKNGNSRDKEHTREKKRFYNLKAAKHDGND
ncbi:unnamed protein product, partial [Acanthocheilonema viteae]